jgi:hypothetical protein
LEGIGIAVTFKMLAALMYGTTILWGYLEFIFQLTARHWMLVLFFI